MSSPASSNEARAVNDIGHQNIVDIVDFGRARLDAHGPETVYLIMEFLEGESLAGRLRRQPLTLAETLHVMEQSCSALHASHQKGIVHRDLKPENIFVCTRGNDPLFVKILDFGIAKLTGDGTTQKTRTGAVIGTPAYMSPEQCEGRGHVDHRSDVYSMGVVMYELLTGRVPFVGEGFGEILVAQMTRAPEPPSRLNPQVRPEIEAIVMHALEKDRNLRFQSMADLAGALRNPVGHMQTYRSFGTGSTMSFDSAPTVTSPRQPVATTLSGTSGELSDGKGHPIRTGGGGGGSAKLIVGLGLAGLLVGGGVTAWSLRRGPAPADPTTTTTTTAVAPRPTTPEGPPAVPPPARDEFVSIKITSTPPGAEIVRADGAAGDRTPALLKVKRGAPSFDVALRLAGYKTSSLTVETDHDGALDATLTAAPVETPPPVAKAAHKPSAKPARHSSSKPAKAAAPSGKPKTAADDPVEVPSWMKK